MLKKIAAPENKVVSQKKVFTWNFCPIR